MLFVGGGVLILMGFVAIFMAASNANKTQAQHELAKADLERAKSEREMTHLAIEKNEITAANERALILSKARDNALSQILVADLDSKNLLVRKIQDRGGLAVSFSDGNNEKDEGYPRISWKWSPFENAVIKVYRNSGTILEEINSVMKQATLIHVEQFKPEGSYHDREAKAGQTYNYYAFIETRRTGVKAEPITLDLPAEVRTGKVIDSMGNEVTAFQTVQPSTYEEAFYHGFQYRRVRTEKFLDPREKRRAELTDRREDLELTEEELELQRLERDIGLRSGEIDTKQIQLLIEEAKRLTNRQDAICKAEAMLDNEDVDVRQREIIMAHIRKSVYR